MGLGKNQHSAAGEGAFKRLLYGDQLRRAVTIDQLGGGGTRNDPDCRHRQEHLLANHLAEAYRSSADAHVSDFSERILFSG
jgi:hypothetical protein